MIEPLLLAPALSPTSRPCAVNRLRPFGGEQVHWTFSYFRLTSRRRGVLSPSPCGTTAWMQEVEQSREHLPRRVGQAMYDFILL